MIIDFNAHSLFGNPTHDIISPLQREFRSTDRKAVQQYIKDRFKCLQEHKLSARINILNSNWDPQLAESLGCNHQQACIPAVNKAKQKPNVVFKRRLANIRAQKSVIQKLLSGH